VAQGGVRRCLPCAPVACRRRMWAHVQDAYWITIVEGVSGGVAGVASGSGCIEVWPDLRRVSMCGQAWGREYHAQNAMHAARHLLTRQAWRAERLVVVDTDSYRRGTRRSVRACWRLVAAVVGAV
jgi:hypothetical protein